MARRNKQSVERYHDRVAHSYDDSYRDAYWQWHDAITWDFIKQYLPKDHQAPVLDLGCGTGKWAAKLAKSGFGVTCVDISSAMIDRAQRKLSETKESRKAFLHADLCDLSELPRDHFALAVAMGDPIGCTTSPPKALKEIRRVLAPGGVLVASFDNRLNALDFHVNKNDSRSLADFLRSGKTRWITQDDDERFDIFTYTPSQLRKLLQNGGFDVRDMIGVTVLPMRSNRRVLEDAADRRAWMKIEKSLHRHESAMGRAAHLYVAAGTGFP